MREFKKDPDWKIYSQSKEGDVKHYSIVTPRNIFSMKSVARCRESMDDILWFLGDMESRKKWD